MYQTRTVPILLWLGAWAQQAVRSCHRRPALARRPPDLAWRCAALGLVAALSGCSDRSPQGTVLALDGALRRDDRTAVGQLITRNGRPLVSAMMALSAGSQTAQPFRLAAGAAPLTVSGVQVNDARAIVQVSAGGEQRDWVLLQEDGAWRLDLFETALRRPWPGRL